MAQIQKIKKTAIKLYFNHCNRTEGDGVDRSNECIDNERTHLNYHFKQGGNREYKSRLNNLYYPENRDDVVTFASCVVTLPKNVRDEDQEKFFEGCYEFLCEEFGYDNVINAVVHMDETTPHIHLGFIPAITMDAKEIPSSVLNKIEKWCEDRGLSEPEGIVSAKDVLNRAFFQNFHPRLYNFMEKKLGYEVEILNGATAGGNKTILELKNQKIEEQLKAKEEEVQKLSANITIINKQLDTLGIDKRYMDMGDILNKMSAMQEENKIFRDLLIQNKIALPREVAQTLKDMKNSYHIGNVETLSGIFVPNKEFVVVETFKDKERPLPLDEYISHNITLTNTIRYKKPKAVLEVADLNNKFLVVPTDNIADTVEALYWIKQHEDKYKSLSLCQFSNDPDNLVREILQNSQIDTEYFIDLQKNDDKERNKDRVLIN